MDDLKLEHNGEYYDGDSDQDEDGEGEAAWASRGPTESPWGLLRPTHQQTQILWPPAFSYQEDNLYKKVTHYTLVNKSL